jgi:hypothetical protein
VRLSECKVGLRVRVNRIDHRDPVYEQEEGHKYLEKIGKIDSVNNFHDHPICVSFGHSRVMDFYPGELEMVKRPVPLKLTASSVRMLMRHAWEVAYWYATPDEYDDDTKLPAESAKRRDSDVQWVLSCAAERAAKVSR